MVKTAGAEGLDSGDAASDDKIKINTSGYTVPNPPRFFEDDMQKWKKKFVNALKHRENMKKLITKTDQITCLTLNTNVKAGSESHR